MRFVYHGLHGLHGRSTGLFIRVLLRAPGAAVTFSDRPARPVCVCDSIRVIRVIRGLKCDFWGSSTNRVREFAGNQILLFVGFRGASCDSPRSGLKD